MFERTMNLPAEEVYPTIKGALIAKGSKVTYEEPPRRIEARQGSLWGITPQSAKKNIIITLTAKANSTQITCRTRLASDWKNVTSVGCVLAVVFAGICIWLAVDLGGFLANFVPSFWSWVITEGNEANIAAGKILVSLAWGLAGFLLATILVELGVVLYVKSKIDKVMMNILA